MTLAASLFPIFCWGFYTVFASWLEKRRPSLSIIMGAQRHRWVRNAVRRETPMDAILSGNLMGAVSFFASTTVLIILALIAVFGQISAWWKLSRSCSQRRRFRKRPLSGTLCCFS